MRRSVGREIVVARLPRTLPQGGDIERAEIDGSGASGGQELGGREATLRMRAGPGDRQDADRLGVEAPDRVAESARRG